jgi:hypothetical protein
VLDIAGDVEDDEMDSLAIGWEANARTENSRRQRIGHLLLQWRRSSSILGTRRTKMAACCEVRIAKALGAITGDNKSAI